MAPRIARESAQAPDARSLQARARSELDALYPGHPKRAEGGPPAVFLVARDESGRPIACGGVWRSAEDAGSGELRKMYVTPGSRGSGLGRRLLEALEQAAAAEGLDRLYLETGTLQQQALALYGSSGYTPMPCFEPFHDEPQSRCFEKRLGGRR